MQQQEVLVITAGSSFSLAQFPQASIEEINISAKDGVLDYTAALVIAGQAVAEAMLLAWYDGKNSAGYPDVHECTGDKPGWLAYAEPRWKYCSEYQSR